MSQFIGTSMPRGFAGELTRGMFDCTVEIKPNDGTTPVSAFGVPVMLNGTADAVVLGTTYSSIIGFSVRNYGQATLTGEQPRRIVSVLKRGYIAIAFEGGTPAPEGVVYVKSDGTLSASSSSANAVAGARFTGVVDADGLAEIAYNI